MQSTILSTNTHTKQHTRDWVCVLAFAGLTVVKPPESLVLGDVGVEELEGVFWDKTIGDHFVVSYDVGKWESTEPVLSVRLHGVELHISCCNGK